jgi:flagellar biosynthetic protein FliR
MGFNMATLVDPSTGVHKPVVTQVYEAFFFIGLLAVDGHHMLLRALESSFARAPIGAVAWNGELAWLAVGTFKQMFSAGITFAAPVMVLLAMVSILTGLLARAVPHLNIQDLGFVARIAIGLVAMLIFAPFLAPALDGLYTHLMHALDAGLDALPA